MSEPARLRRGHVRLHRKKLAFTSENNILAGNLT
jgi:hypothetical protein